ncbi:MAG TPA: ester cyclase [Ktedonosporobacter sp.]|nr:ester cyclase [Ktedonosporobacter sp.]
MSVEANKAIMRRLFEEGFNQGNLAVVDELFDTQFVDHSTPEQPIGRGGVKDYIAQVHADLPDIHVIIDDLIAEEDKVVVRTTWQGAHQGRVSTSTMIQIFRIHNGKILEEWNEGHH